MRPRSGGCRCQTIMLDGWQLRAEASETVNVQSRTSGVSFGVSASRWFRAPRAANYNIGTVVGVATGHAIPTPAECKRFAPQARNPSSLVVLYPTSQPRRRKWPLNFRSFTPLARLLYVPLVVKQPRGTHRVGDCRLPAGIPAIQTVRAKNATRRVPSWSWSHSRVGGRRNRLVAARGA